VCSFTVLLFYQWSSYVSQVRVLSVDSTQIYISNIKIFFKEFFEDVVLATSVFGKRLFGSTWKYARSSYVLFSVIQYWMCIME